MHLQIVIAFERQPDGVYINVFHENAHDRVGPVDVTDPSAMYKAILSITEEKVKNIPSQRLRKRSRREEMKIAADIGGRAQPGSGNQAHAKGDIRLRGRHRLESKTTTTKQYIVKRSELDKIRGECGMGETPVFIMTFVNKGTLREEDKWVLIPYEEWHASHLHR